MFEKYKKNFMLSLKFLNNKYLILDLKEFLCDCLWLVNMFNKWLSDRKF